MDPTVTAENQAYITSVYNNSYQYFNPDTKGLIIKNTNSTFAGLVGTGSGQTLVWETPEGEDTPRWIVKALAETTGGFNYKDEGYDGIIFNYGGEFRSVDMSSIASINAVTWDSETSGVALVALNELTTMDTSSMVNGEAYVIKKTTEGEGEGETVTYSLTAVPVLPGNSNDRALVYTGGATSSTFDLATPENLMGITQTGNNLVVADPEGSSWAALSLPAAPASGSDFYHLSVDSEGNYSYVKVVDSLSANGINLTAATDPAAADMAIISTPKDLTSAPQFTAGLNYLYDVTFDIYVDDIIALVAGGATGRTLIDNLPLITIKVGNEILGTYRVKPNQPIQTVHVNHVVPDLAADPEVTVECTFTNGYPDSASQADIIQYIKDSLIATMTPAGSGATA